MIIEGVFEVIFGFLWVVNGTREDVELRVLLFRRFVCFCCGGRRRDLVLDW